MVQSELGQWTSTLIKTSVRLGWRKDKDRLGRRGPAVIAKEFVSAPVAILVTALSIGSADVWAAGASDQVDLQFSSSEPLTLTCEKLSSKGVPLELWNNSARERRVTFRISEFRDAKGAVVPEKDRCPVLTPPPISLGPAEAVTVMLTGAAARSTTTGTYSASIAAFDEQSGAVARRTLELSVNGGSGLVATPLVETFSATVYRSLPFEDVSWWPSNWDGAVPFQRIANFVFPAPPKDEIILWLPLEGDVKLGEPGAKLQFEQDQELGSISGTAGTAVVDYGNESRKADTGTYAVRLKVVGLKNVGDFEGKVHLVPDDSQHGDVTVKLTRKDFVGWPILAVIVGIAIALYLRRLGGVVIATLGLLRREAQLGLLFERAQHDYSVAAGGQGRKYDLTPAVTAKRSELHGRILKLETANYVQASPSEVAAIALGFDEIESTINGWPAFGTSVDALAAALNELKGPRPSPLPPLRGPGTHADEPESSRISRPLLVGQPLIDFDEVKRKRAEIKEATDLAQQLREIEVRLSSAWRALNLIEPNVAVQSDKVKVALARTNSKAALVEVWTVPNRARLKEAATKTDIRAIENIVTELSRYVPDEHSYGVRASLDFANGIPLEHLFFPESAAHVLYLDVEPTVSQTQPSAADDAALAEHYRRAGMRRQIALIAVAFGVAVVTFLTAAYIGKPFGTWWDYLLAVTWAITTTAVLDGVATALGGLGIFNKQSIVGTAEALARPTTPQP